MNTELATKLAQAITARDELTAAIDRAQKPADEWPKDGDIMYTLDQCEVVKCRWSNGEKWQRMALARGNVYRTQAEAERADQRRIVEAELRKMALEAGPVGHYWYEARWDGHWSPVPCDLQSPSGIRFQTKESCAAAIAALGDRLDLLLDEGE